jgi:glycosyltransferase involved in cell wall biosynthesis
MELSVVVPTLNGRDRLAGCLDALAVHAPAAEVVVVNGPSTDGTSGMVREHGAVDRLVEVAERNINVSRNVGLAVATGDVVAALGVDSAVEPTWVEAIEAGIGTGADAVTGPVHRQVSGGMTTGSVERTTIAGREVTYFDGGNVAFTREAIRDLDGFDEYLDTGAARDAAHRLAGLDREVAWQPEMAVLREHNSDVADRIASDQEAPVWGLKYRSLAYRLAKNYGPRPTVATRLVRHAVADALGGLREVISGDEVPSRWAANGRDVLTNAPVGVKDGLAARSADRSPTRNPNGISSRTDRAVAEYDLA